jgi:uncharacterized damage-inducible protein DinB
MTQDDALRGHLAKVLDWQDAHATFEDAVKGIPAQARGRRAEGLPYSPWQLVEHLRITQRDILDFCGHGYRERDWPGDYWPADPSPPSAEAWDASIAAYRADREALKRLATDPATDLLAPVPEGSGQTYLREILLAADHAAYHVGQLVVVRRLLGIWPAG